MPSYMMPTVVRNAQTGQTKAQESDHQTAGTLSIMMPHYELHKGRYFRVLYEFEEVDVSSYVEALICVTRYACIHIKFQVLTPNSPWAFMVCEDPTYTDPGARRWPVNKNREIGGRPYAEFYISPTISNAGTTLCYHNAVPPCVPDACNMRLGTGEWLLARSHDYYLRVYNQSEQSAYTMYLIMEFYEEPWRDPNDPSRA